MKYYWSFEFELDDEFYRGPEDTIEDCIKEAKEYNEEIENHINKNVFIGKFEKYEPCIDAEWVIETLMNSAYDECAECSEPWLNDTTKKERQSLEVKLNNALQEWLRETDNEPDYFGKIINIKEYSLETGEVVEF